MRILENAVTKYYWQKMYRYLFRKLNRQGQIRHVPGTRVHDVYCGKECRTYCIVEKHKDSLRPIAWLYLWRKPGWAAWEVMQVFSFPAYRGKGLARQLYKAAIDVDRIIILSGKTQAEASRALWRSFIRRNDFNIWVQDVNDLRTRSQVWLDDEGAVESNLQIYHPMTTETREDVRFVAIRRRPNVNSIRSRDSQGRARRKVPNLVPSS